MELLYCNNDSRHHLKYAYANAWIRQNTLSCISLRLLPKRTCNEHITHRIKKRHKYSPGLLSPRWRLTTLRQFGGEQSPDAEYYGEA